MYDLFTSDEPHFLCQETCTGVLSGVFRHFIHFLPIHEHAAHTLTPACALSGSFPMARLFILRWGPGSEVFVLNPRLDL